jgi:hypothetical protein
MFFVGNRSWPVSTLGGPVLKIAVPYFEIGLELTAVFMNNGTRILGSVLSGGVVVSVIDVPRARKRVRATVTPRALGFISFILMLALLQAAMIAGATDCAQGVDSVRCNLAQFIAG